MNQAFLTHFRMDVRELTKDRLRTSQEPFSGQVEQAQLWLRVHTVPHLTN